MNAAWETRLSSPIPERAIALTALWGRETEHCVIEQSVEPRVEEPPSVTDEEALIRLKAQDRDALSLLFERYSRLIVTIAYRILGDYGEAEDVMQNLFLYLYQKADLYEPDRGSAKSWIIQKAYSRALDRRDFLAYRQIYFGTESGVQPDNLTGDFDLEHEIGSKLIREQLLNALCELPEKQHLTLKLNFFEGLDLREISERLGDSLAHVRHNYYRGLDKLRKSALVKSLRGKKL
jgi:RNA polymerase sigma-70 factor (ECF subfamily)